MSTSTSSACTALPWNYCPTCEVDVGDDMRTGEYRDGSECTCRGCGTVYVATYFDDGTWELLTYEEDPPYEDDEVTA